MKAQAQAWQLQVGPLPAALAVEALADAVLTGHCHGTPGVLQAVQHLPRAAKLEQRELGLAVPSVQAGCFSGTC